MTHEEFIDQYLQRCSYHIKDDILYVDDNIDIRNSKITGWLDLERTNITSLPEKLFVGYHIFSDTKLTMTEKTQLNLIQQNNRHFYIIKNPTKKAIAMQKLLWEL